MTAESWEENGDAELVVLAREGDQSAFTILHGRYERLVVSVVHGEMRRGSAAADADDVVQDVFTMAWQRLGTLRDPDLFRPWLLQIARRSVIDHARRQARRPTLDADDERVLDSIPQSDDSPEMIAELSDLVSRLGGALDGMSRRDATAITLAAQFGFGPSEIAEALSITPNNAKVVLHRARTRLRATIAEPALGI